MELAVAIGLIEKGIAQGNEPQLWVELGAGKGLFTRALSTLLPAGSTIHAMDIDNTSLKSIALEVDNITLVKSKLDFVRDPLPLKNVDGLLFANAIHFAPNKIQLAKNLRKHLKEGGKLILVEYDTDTANAGFLTQ